MAEYKLIKIDNVNQLPDGALLMSYKAEDLAEKLHPDKIYYVESRGRGGNYTIYFASSEKKSGRK